MSMDQAAAERWVTISAVTVAGIYAYRRLIEPSTPPATVKKLMGVGELPPLGSWATAWGFTFLVVAIMAEASPPLGGSFAILIMTADILTNASNLFADVGKQQGATTSTGVPSAQQALAATDPLSGLAGSTASERAASVAEGFSTAPRSTQTAGVNPKIPVYVQPGTN
jgi:hypothetical protein